MKHLITTFLLIFSVTIVYGQNDTWTLFWNNDSTLFGYKNKAGIVKIKPKFTGLTTAVKFERILAATEKVNNGYKFYYLLKSGKIFGEDSLYVFDNATDCESEGFIRFKDKKTDKTGMFNSRGNIVIPAVYNDLTKVRNGMVIALQGASKNRKPGSEHFSWSGGEEMLIDTANHILVRNFKNDENINLFSLKVTKHPKSDSIRKDFKSTDGNYFSFIDFDKEFKAWLNHLLSGRLTKRNLEKASFGHITYYSNKNGWKSETSSSFINRNFNVVQSKLLELKNAGCNYTILTESLNKMIFESDEYNSFFNNCNESDPRKYPVKTIVISYRQNHNVIQDRLAFLRTNKGYRLIEVTLKSNNLR